MNSFYACNCIIEKYTEINIGAGNGQTGGPTTWRVSSGVSSVELTAVKQNKQFLCSRKSYRDQELFTSHFITIGSLLIIDTTTYQCIKLLLRCY